MSHSRVDKVLLEIYPELTRSKIQHLIDEGTIFYRTKGREDWIKILKPSLKMNQDELEAYEWRFENSDQLKYVSRGALKLIGAASSFGVTFLGNCLDVGLSTGGFSDVLLQNGAKKVLGIDVGTGQVHEKLRKNPNLVWFDKINAKEPLPFSIVESFFKTPPFVFDFIVVDVSFISVDKILKNLSQYLAPEGKLICLIKPQFELGRKELNRQGVVKNQSLVEDLKQKMVGVFAENGLKHLDDCSSPIEGENGNKEFFIYAQLLDPPL